MKNETDKTKHNRYNFEENLLALSESKNIDDAMNEWSVINKNYEVLSEGRVVCICNKTIKHVHYACNLRTNKFAYLGTACVGKFRTKIKHITNNTLRNVFMDMIGDGLYQRIFDIQGYSDEVRIRLTKHFETTQKHYKSLDDYLKELKELIDDYGCDFLSVIYDKYFCSCCKSLLNNYYNEGGLCSYCIRLNQEQQDMMKTDAINSKQRVCSRCHQYSSAQCHYPGMNIHEYLCLKCDKHFQKYHEERKKFIDDSRREEFIKQPQNEVKTEEVKTDTLCGCGILHRNLCKCSNPSYSLVQINQQLWCNSCNNWKCRCS